MADIYPIRGPSPAHGGGVEGKVIDFTAP